eukprot:g23594.t1
MQKAAEERKKRKEKNLAAGTAYAAQKVEVSKFKARDSDNDIFSGAGSFDANEFVQKARAEQAAKQGPQSLQDAKAAKAEAKREKEKDKEKSKERDKAKAKASYFDDAGDEKYRCLRALVPSCAKFKGARKNWVFKLGEQGLGYYEALPPKKKVEAAPPQEKDPRKRKAAKSSGSGPQGMGNPGNDAYDELFPNAMMGGAMMTTHSDDSDEDEAKKKKDKKGADKKKVNEDTGTQIATQPVGARIKSLEAAIEADPYDLGAWDARLRESIQAESSAWDSAMALGVYSRCLQQVPNMDLWLSYLNFSKRHQTLEEVLRSYGRAIDLLGSDWRAAPVWSDYLALLKHAYNLKQKKDIPLFYLWRAILRFERTNPLQLDTEELTARVALVYQQASLACGFFPDLWYDFSAWLDLGKKQEEATEVLRKAVQRFLPKDTAVAPL